MAIEVPDTRGNAAMPARPGSGSGVGAEPPAGGSAFSRRRPVRRAAKAAVAEPTAEPTAEPAAEPAGESAPQPAAPAKRAASRRAAATKPAPQPAAQPAPQPEPVPEPLAPAPEPDPVPVSTGTPAAQAPTEAPTAEPTQTVVIRLGGTRYALEMDAVAEVGRPPRLTRVPGVPEWVAGVVNWRGRVLAVLDLRPLLAAPTPALPATGRVVVLSAGGVSVGVLTERVDGVASLEPDATEPALPTLPSTAAGLVTGQVTDAEGPLALLDARAVLGLRNQLPRARRAG